jgi:hypothetical protein
MVHQFKASLPAYFLGSQEVHDAMLLPVINRTPLFPSNADFNQISSVWAKGKSWQAVSNKICLMVLGGYPRF